MHVLYRWAQIADMKLAKAGGEKGEEWDEELCNLTLYWEMIPGAR